MLSFLSFALFIYNLMQSNEMCTNRKWISDKQRSGRFLFLDGRMFWYMYICNDNEMCVVQPERYWPTNSEMDSGKTRGQQLLKQPWEHGTGGMHGTPTASPSPPSSPTYSSDSHLLFSHHHRARQYKTEDMARPVDQQRIGGKPPKTSTPIRRAALVMETVPPRYSFSSTRFSRDVEKCFMVLAGCRPHDVAESIVEAPSLHCSSVVI